MADKIVRLKIVADTSETDKVISSTVELVSKIPKALDSAAPALVRQKQLHLEITSELQRATPIYERMKASVDKINKALEENRINSGLAAGAAKSIQTAYDSAISPIVENIRKMRSELSSLSNAANLSASSSTKIYGPKKDYDKVTNYATGETISLKEQADKKEAILKRYHENVARSEEEFNTKLRALANQRRQGQELEIADYNQKLKDDAAKKEAILKAYHANAAKSEEDFNNTLKRLADQRRNAQIQEIADYNALIAERTRIATAARDRAAVSKETIKSNIANSYRTETDQIVAELNRRMELEHSTRVNGANSAKTLELKSSQEQVRIREKLTSDLLAIENKLKAGTIDRSRATLERNYLLGQAEANLRLADSINQVGQAHRSLAGHIFEIIGLYRIYNAIINTTLNAIRSIPKIGIELESTVASLTATTGSAAGMVSVMKALHAEAQRTGIEIGVLRESFRGFQASTSLAGETIDTTWRIFTNLNTVITGLHLSTDKANSIFLALSQIFNKNKVQSEELVKQLGNLLPGAFASFAAANKSMFKSSEELIAKMKQGVVFAHDTVDNFARFLADRFAPSFALANKGLNAEIGRMNTAFTELGEAIYGLTSGVLIEAVKQMTSFANALRDAAKGSTDLGKSLELIGVILGGAIFGSITATLLGLRNIGGAMAALTGTASILTRLGAGFTALRVAMTGALFGPAGVIAGIATLGYYLHKLATEGDRDRAKIQETIDLINSKAVDVKKVPLEIQVDNDPLVQQISAALLTARRQVSDMERKITLGQSVIAVNGEIKDLSTELTLARVNVTKLRDGLNEARATARDKIQLNLGTDQALKDLGTIREKIRVLYLNAVGDTEGAAKLQFDITNRESEAQLKTQIDLLNGKKKEWEGLITTLGNIPAEKLTEKQAEQLRAAKEGIEALKSDEKSLQEYQIARENAGVKTAKTVTTAYEQSNTALKELISNLKLASNEAIDSIKFKAESFKNIAELGKIKGNPTNELTLINAEFSAKEKALKKQLELNNQIIEATKKAQVEQRGYTETTYKSVEQIWKKMKEIESSNGKNLVSKTGALGNFQIQPSTLNEQVKVPDNILALEVKAKQLNKKGLSLSEQDKNVLKEFAVTHEKELDTAAFNYYKSLVDKFQGNFIKAAAAYNAGPNLKAFKQENYQDLVPQETQDYINKLGGVKAAKSEVELSKDLNELTRERLQLAQSLTLNEQERVKAIASTTKEFRNYITDVKINLLQERGQESKAQELATELEFRDKIAFVTANGTAADIKAVQALKDRKLVSSELLDFTRKTTIAENVYNLAVQRVNSEINAGNVTQLAGYRQLKGARTDFFEALQKELDAVNAKLLKDKEDIKLLEQKYALEQKIAQVTADSGTAKKLRDQAIDNVFPGFSSSTNEFQSNKANLEQDTINRQTDLTRQYNAGLIAHEDYYKGLGDIEDRYRTASNTNTLGYFQGMFKVGSDTFMGLTIAAQKMYGAQSKQARMAFAAYKAMTIAQAVIATAMAIINVWSGPVGKFPPAAAAVSAAVGALGLIQVATIAAQPMPAAHGGLDSVPKEQTYLLDKGERVLSPNQNRDLTSYLKDRNSPSNNVVPMKQDIKIVNAIDSSSLDEYLVGESSTRIIRNIIRQEAG